METLETRQLLEMLLLAFRKHESPKVIVAVADDYRHMYWLEREFVGLLIREQISAKRRVLTSSFEVGKNLVCFVARNDTWRMRGMRGQQVDHVFHFRISG